MKLSKKGAAIQRAIHDALASGKALGGLLVGFAATVAGCGERHTPANTMGKYPSPYYQENATNENTEVFVTEGDIDTPLPVPGEPPLSVRALSPPHDAGADGEVQLPLSVLLLRMARIPRARETRA